MLDYSISLRHLNRFLCLQIQYREEIRKELQIDRMCAQGERHIDPI